MLWAVWDHFQGGSLCLTSVSCFFRLTSSVALWGGGMLQTNSTVVCTQYLTPLDLSFLTAHKPLRLYDAQPGTVWGRP